LIGRRFGFETTPIVVDGTRYYTTGINRVISLIPPTARSDGRLIRTSI
jgi:hypothetical protein